MYTTKILKAEKYATEYITKKTNGKINSIDFRPLNKEEKNIEDYVKALSCFKLLFASNDKMIKLALWDECVNCFEFVENNLTKEDFTDGEYKFLQFVYDKIKEDNGRYGDYNINNDFCSSRLTFRAMNEELSKKCIKHIVKDKEFESYFRLPKRKQKMLYLHRSLYFAILKKDSKEMIGYIGFAQKEPIECKFGNIEYYIFKEHRRNGYAKEAICTFSDELFSKKLYVNKETEYQHCYKKKKADIDLIRAIIYIDNVKSINTIKSCGFLYEGTIHNRSYYNKQIIDFEHYYFTKQIWEDMKK